MIHPQAQVQASRAALLLCCHAVAALVALMLLRLRQCVAVFTLYLWCGTALVLLFWLWYFSHNCFIESTIRIARFFSRSYTERLRETTSTSQGSPFRTQNNTFPVLERASSHPGL